VRITNRWIIAAVAGGALLAAAPILALDWAFTSYVEGQARVRLAARAQGSIGLAEARLEQASTVLRRLAASGIDECSPPTLEALRLAVFTTTPLKGLSILDDQGRALCTHLGALVDAYVVSREYLLPEKGFALAAARFRDLADRAVRLTLDLPGGRSLSALIAVDALLPELELEQGAGGRRLRLLFDSGEMIVSRPNGDEGVGLDDGESLAARYASLRYPILVVAEESRRALAANYRDLLFMARLGMVLLLGCVIGTIWLFVQRQQDDPAAALRRAVQDGEIIPYYQPTVDTRNGRIRGAEVLARWRKSDGTIISPAHFIPLAEQSGIIFDLTRSLMKRARDDMGPAYRNRPQLRLGFNLFAGHFADENIVEDVRRIFEGSMVSTDQIVLEVTERTPLPDLGRARRIIEMLQSMGIFIAIDDVGTGHGGLSYLLKLGVDIIKIDKMFVDAIGTERYSQTIIETLVELAHTMKMEVIAEGVETLEQVEYLRLKGVFAAQGYTFAPPLPASSFIALVEAMERPKLSVVSERKLAAGAA
jgi:sensor c-di-GMP phosphodiesterase-like protein